MFLYKLIENYEKKNKNNEKFEEERFVIIMIQKDYKDQIAAITASQLDI